MDLREIRAIVEQKKGKRDLLRSQLEQEANVHKALTLRKRKLEQAQVIVQQAALLTQQELQFHISSIVTIAMEAVFPDPYEMGVEFVERRGRTEVDLFFLNGENRIDPLSGAGGGIVDIAAFALRVSLWNLRQPPSRNVLILDEPFRFLSQDLQPKAAEMIKLISEKMNLQIILVTHQSALIECANKLFEVSQKRKKTIIKVGG